MLTKDVIILRVIVLCAASNSLLPIMGIFAREPRIDFLKSEFKLLQSESEEIGTATVATEGHNMSATYPNCTGYDVITCCWSSVNLPCSEFNSDPAVVETCGKDCGIPCVDDSGDPDVGIIVESEDNNGSNVSKCYDHKPQVCCQFLARNSLCSETYFTGCRKSCSQC